MLNEGYLSVFGDTSRFSAGTGTVMADRQIKRGLQEGKVWLEEVGNAKAIVTYRPIGKWFMISGGWGNDNVGTAMLGAIAGDVAGSIYEWHNIKYEPDKDKLIAHNCRFTDDTVMTCAVAVGIMNGLKQLPKEWIESKEYEEILLKEIAQSLKLYGRRYPRAGYGGRFRQWLSANDMHPYNSYGNGSAMRVSYAGWVANSLGEAEKLGEISAKVTHNHPEGIKGAKVISGCIFIMRTSHDKEKVREYASKYYDLDFTLNEIRDKYSFDASCQGSVPQAIKAFLEGENFVDVIAKAISIGRDSDTIAAIAGSIAEVDYPITQGVRGRVIDRVDKRGDRVFGKSIFKK